MKKVIFILIFVIVSLVFFGCNSDKENKNSMPTLEELKEAFGTEEYDEKLKEIQKNIDDASYEDICSNIEKTLDEWVENQNLLEIEDTSIEFSQDETMMNLGLNEKLYANIFVKIRVDYKSDKDIENERDLAYQAIEEIKQVMSKNIYCIFKVANKNSLCIGFYNNNKLRYGWDTLDTNEVYSTGKQNIKIETNLAEMNVQTIVYDFVKKWDKDVFDKADNPNYSDKYPNIFLKNFGLLEDDNSLYIGIIMFSAYFGESEEETLEDLEDKSIEIKNLILENEEAKKFLKEKGVTKIKILFNTRWTKENFHSYEYDI
ncbi:MAG: hypothetical protein CSB16_01710 [Clostridiales bacterium]|nr:MAG: hypothetical protein CSB16_01710 [Clostridiales bacterium]